MSLLPVILEQIKDKKVPQQTVAETYANLIIQEFQDCPWQVVNTAIAQRWRKAGLARVKKLAWIQVREKTGVQDAGKFNE